MKKNIFILESEIYNVEKEQDIVRMRKIVREKTISLKFSLTQQTKLVTATSELTRNIIKYANKGTLQLNHLSDIKREGLQLIFTDQGPGIADVARVMIGGYTTGGGLGLGLSGSRRLVDEFEMISKVGEGTCIKLISWK